MTKEMLLGMLRAGQNGEQILNILDTITSDFDSDVDADIAGGYADAMQDQPTLEEMVF